MIRRVGSHPPVVVERRMPHGRNHVVTWISSRTDEQPTRVTVELSDDGNATLVRLTHELLPSASSAEDHREGWNRILAELEAFAVG